jgi:hypothetical protein
LVDWRVGIFEGELGSPSGLRLRFIPEDGASIRLLGHALGSGALKTDASGFGSS